MKILIADDHPLIVEALSDKLAELGPDVQVAVAVDVPSLYERVAEAPDLALIDLIMPGAEGWAHVQEVRRREPELPIIILSGHEDPAMMRETLDGGVRGFIQKSCSPAVMLSAVRLVLAGGIYVPPGMLGVADGAAASALAPDVQARPVELPGQQPDLQTLRELLTERQIDVLRLLWKGEPNKMISRILNISEGTVKVHLAAIFRALNARNRTEAVMMTAHAAMEMQHVSDPAGEGTEPPG